MSDDVKVLFPGRVITLNGETHTVKPFIFGQLRQVLGVIGKVSDKLKGDKIDVLDLLATSLDDVGQLMALSIGQTPGWVNALSMPDAVTLATAVLDENRQLFRDAVMPKVSELLAGLGLEKSTGETSSAPSSQPDTDTQTSKDTP